MSVKTDHSEDEEGTHGPEVTVLETNRFGFILGNGETDRSVLMSVHSRLSQLRAWVEVDLSVYHSQKALVEHGVCYTMSDLWSRHFLSCVVLIIQS